MKIFFIFKKFKKKGGLERIGLFTQKQSSLSFVKKPIKSKKKWNFSIQIYEWGKLLSSPFFFMGFISPPLLTKYIFFLFFVKKKGGVKNKFKKTLKKIKKLSMRNFFKYLKKFIFLCSILINLLFLYDILFIHMGLQIYFFIFEDLTALCWEDKYHYIIGFEFFFKKEKYIFLFEVTGIIKLFTSKKESL